MGSPAGLSPTGLGPAHFDEILLKVYNLIIILLDNFQVVVNKHQNLTFYTASNCARHEMLLDSLRQGSATAHLKCTVAYLSYGF